MVIKDQATLIFMGFFIAFLIDFLKKNKDERVDKD